MTNRKPKKATAAPLPSVNAPPIQPAAGGELRALPLFDRLGPEHMTFLVQDQGSEPHLKKGEYAVVDLSDRALQHGELYVIQWGTGRRTVLEARWPRWARGWYVRDPAGFREEDGLLCGLSDGPYRTELLQSRMIGRVVGFALSPLGDLLACCAEVPVPPGRPAPTPPLAAANDGTPLYLQRWLDAESVKAGAPDRSR